MDVAMDCSQSSTSTLSPSLIPSSGLHPPASPSMHFSSIHTAASSPSSSRGEAAGGGGAAMTTTVQGSGMNNSSIPAIVSAGKNMAMSKSDPPTSVPPFLAKLFEQEKVRRQKALLLGDNSRTRASRSTTTDSSTSNASNASRQDSNNSNCSTASNNLPPNISPVSETPSTGTSISNTTNNMPGLVYSASSVASSDTSSFHADAGVGAGGVGGGGIAVPTLPSSAIVDVLPPIIAPSGFSSSILTGVPDNNHTKKQMMMAGPPMMPMLPSYAATYNNYPRPPSHYDYAASSASSAGGDDTFAVSENGSMASRSASPAMKSAGGYSAASSSANHSYSSPTTSPFFHHYQNNSTHVHNQHPHHTHQHQHQHQLQQQHLHLQPLKLPPPSLDLQPTPPTSLSSRTASCDTLSTVPTLNGNVVAARRCTTVATSPQGYPNSSTADTSQTTTPGVASTEMAFSPLGGGGGGGMRGGFARSVPRQHYSPLHPFHQQGLMSPQRPPGLYTSLGLLAPEAESHHGPFLCPPDNFAMVQPNVYRSSFPSAKNFDFLKTLHLKTVLILVQDEEYPQVNKDFFKSQKIRCVTIGIPGNKEPFVTIPDEKIRRALSIVLDKRNHPLLIHCNKGKHRTGCLVGCLRKMQCWSSTAIFEEYRRFSFPKSRAMDQLFIELFQPDWSCVELPHLPDWCEGEDAGLSGRRTPSLDQQPAKAASKTPLALNGATESAAKR